MLTVFGRISVYNFAKDWDKTQDKKITSFQPAWLIRCSTPHQGQPSAILSCLHLRIWQPATYGCHMNCCIV